MIVGIGIDIVEVERIRNMLERHGARFVRRVFTDGEVKYCCGRKRAAEHFAARFAAKEAALKALRIGLRKGITWRDMDVVIGDLGQPDMRLSGGAAERAEELGVNHMHVTLTHTENYAAATVVAEH
ncbi:MAG: holo-ACP synthase [Planctomycetes bacterium]|nr:holo-ACP synthase [Planctomycetota bacterium]